MKKFFCSDWVEVFLYVALVPLAIAVLIAIGGCQK